jgi:L-asparaginase II
MKTIDLDVVATRGAEIESRHRVHAAIVGPADTLITSAHDVAIVSSWRSCAKPFQAMPLVESGGFDDLHWGDDQLALSCASHGGEPEHVAIAQAMLEDIGLEEGDLACGPHDPLSSRGMKLLRDSGARLTRLHNNCSGKHAAMLARAHTAGWHTYGYERRDHPVQQCSLKSVAHWAAMEMSDIGMAIDGCGVVAASREHGARLVALGPRGARQR